MGGVSRRARVYAGTISVGAPRHALKRAAQIDHAARAASWRRLRTGATGSGACSARRLARSNSAVVIDSKSAC